jgi:glycosyltransferase involved in cell wall biosynthesis
MKIVFLSFYNGLIDRGVELFVKELATRLSKKNKVIVFQAGASSKNEKYQVVHIPFSKTKKHGNYSVLAFTLKSLIQIIKERPDFIYPLNGRYQALLCRLLTFFISSKLIIGGHAGIGKDDLFNLWLWPDVFVALSKKGKSWAKKWAPHVRIITISHGVDINRFNPKAKPIKINLLKPIILIVAGKEKFKRVDLAIKAVARLKKGSLLVIGDQEKRIILLGKKLLGKKRFKIANFTNRDMHRVYRAADLFTLPSTKREAFGIAYLEAMASNLPVVATNDNLRQEIVDRAGFLIEPANLRLYSRALDKALKKNWYNLPRNQALKFSWDRAAWQYQKLFDRLINKSR